MQSKDFFDALGELEKDRGLSTETEISMLEAALTSACKKYKDEDGVPVKGKVRVITDESRYTIDFYSVKTVVEEVEDDDVEISLEDARERDATLNVGDEYIRELSTDRFSRIAATTANQVVLQKMRETERQNAVNEFSEREGELVLGTIRRVDGKNVMVDLNRGPIEGVMPPSEQVSSEEYRVGQQIKVYVKGVRNGTNSKDGPQVLVSRSNVGLVKKLFEEEVPEIKQGTVVIKAISREPGARSKMAIYSTDERVDAVGACVGNKGSRVNAVVSELGGEKIDIVAWSENPLEFIAKALSPAKVISVTQTGERNALAIVPDDKFSLAIGKSGQNVRLAVRLTDWKIDVKSVTKAKEMGIYTGIESEENEEA